MKKRREKKMEWRKTKNRLVDSISCFERREVREEEECNQLLSERTLFWRENKERTRQLNCHVKTGGWEEDEKKKETEEKRAKETTEINRIKYTLCLYFPSILTQTGLKVKERQTDLLT